MINGNIEQFLDNGWEHDAILYYNDFYYYCNGNFIDDIFDFSVDKMRGFLDKDYLCYYYLFKGELVDYKKDIFYDKQSDKEKIKKSFLEAKIFDDKSFWEIEDKLVWAEDGGSKEIQSLREIK